MTYSALYVVFPATFHVISLKIDYLCDRVQIKTNSPLVPLGSPGQRERAAHPQQRQVQHHGGDEPVRLLDQPGATAGSSQGVNQVSSNHTSLEQIHRKNESSRGIGSIGSISTVGIHFTVC